jgi:hypothetical protein
MTIDTNERTHEPSLRELTSELDGARDVLAERIEALSKVGNERDRRYEDRFKAMDEKTSLALTASEKAVTKAEVSTEKRFDAVNEFRGTLSDQAATLLPRAEASARFTSYDEKFEEMKKEIVSLRESRKGSEGISQGYKAGWGYVVGAVGLVLAVLSIVALLRK